MRMWGSLLAVAVLLGCVGCGREVAGTPEPGDTPPRVSSRGSAAEEPKHVAECTDCDEDAIRAATDNPVVVHGKRVDMPPACETIMPMTTVSQVVGMNAHRGKSTLENQCHVVYEEQDLSRIGQLFVKFSGPSRNEPADISEFEGNTLIETRVDDNFCEYGLAIDDTLKSYDDGSWLIVRVNSENANPPPCGPARQLLELAFGNLVDR
jgi:hypothetical protein